MKTVRRMVSVLLVLCLLLSNIGITAFAESVLALPASTRIIEQEAFFKAQSLNKVVLAEGLLEIRARAFAGSTVKTINFPSSITFIADDAFDDTPLTNVTAVEGTYAYDWAVEHHYIIPKVPIVINSFAADAASVQLGAPVTWTVNVEGGVLPLSYNYAVFKNGLYQDTLSVSDATESVFTFTPTSDGSWSVLVTITDVLETVASQVSGSVYVVDLSSYGDAGLTLTTGLNTYLVDDVAHITAEKQNTYGNVQYAFSATDASGNTLAAQSASSDPSFSLTLSNAGDVTITGTVTDELGRSASAQRTFHVYSEEELKPAAPAVIQVNGEELSSTVENSVLYPQKSFRISWDQVDTADNYSIQIIKTEGNETTTLVSVDGITERS